MRLEFLDILMSLTELLKDQEAVRTDCRSS